MKISPARTAAYDILLRIETQRAFSSILLSQLADVSTADRSLCHELVLGTLRRQIYLDRLVDLFAKEKKLDVEVRVVLRLGVYQLRFTRVPSYSAINESVNLVARARKTSAKGFVNAVLRRTSTEIPVIQFADEIDRVSVETSHPRWLIEKWIAEIGFEETESLAAANNEIRPTAFRVIDGSNAEGETLIAASRKSVYVEGCYIAAQSGGNLHQLATKGLIYIQDEASQMAAHQVKISRAGKILDVCAAPGGKTGLIARNNPASFVAAGDLHAARAEFLRENCRRQGVDSIAVVQYDAVRPLPFAESTFDAVLVDAPCSGTGTIGHNPELRYFLDPTDFDSLLEKQLAILKNASQVVKKGGLLIYSTCSLEREENEVVCDGFLAAIPGFQNRVPSVSREFITDRGDARTWPQRHSMDGFFIAWFERSAEN